jgi:hypothetical protein
VQASLPVATLKSWRMVTSKKRAEFAICVANAGYDDLEVWKAYRVLPDAKAAGVGCIRVVDECGEDYLYPESRFVMVDLPKDVRARLPRRLPSVARARPKHYDRRARRCLH